MYRVNFILVFLMFLSGCALTKEHINIDYVPQSNVEAIRGSEKVNIKLNVTDARTMRDKVSYKKNAYGMEMGEIISDSDVIDLIRKSIKTELQNRGFMVDSGDVCLY